MSLPRVCNRNLDEKLIDIVKQNPILYDINDPRYMNFNEREVVWHKIGDALKRPAYECKARWINIRDINRRILRNVIRHPAKARGLYKYYKHLEFMKPFYRDTSIQNFDVNSDQGGDTEDLSDNQIAELEADPLFNNAIDTDASNFEENREDQTCVDAKTHEHKPLRATQRKLKTKTFVSKRKKRKVKQNMSKPPSVGTNSCILNEANIIRDLDPSHTLDAFLLSIGATMKKFSPYHLNLAKSKIFNIVQQHELQQIMNMQEA